MKNFTKFLGVLLVVFFSFLSHRAEASHYKGGDIYFVCLGGGQYELVTSFYYACEAGSIRFDSVAADFEWTVTSTCGLPSTVIAATTSRSQDVPFYCPGVATTCDYWNGSSYNAPAGTAIGTVVLTYTSAPFTIPDGCTVTASITEGSRNAAITNLQNPGSQSMDISTSVTTPSSGTGCSNNPVFAAYPVNVFCVDQNANFSQGAIDISGDSLTYTLVPPLTSGGIAIPFVAGCSATNPMGAPTYYASVFNFDSTTGNINFTPTQTGNYVLAVQVEAYQGGVLVGTTVRDIQFTVIACTDYTAPPFLPNLFTTANITGGTVIDSTHVGVCPGEPVQINLAATIGDSFQYVIDSTNALQALPGSTVTVTHSGTRYDTATLHIMWTPQNSDSGYHYILVTVKDTVCPLPGRQTYAFLISVLSGLYAGPNLVYCNGGSPVTIYANGANHYLWTDSATGGPPLNVIAYGPDSSWIEVAPTATTGYIVHGDLLGSCKNIDTVTVVNAPDFTLTAAALDTSICKYSTTTLTATASPGSVGPFSYSWTPVASVTSPNAASTSTSHLTNNTQFFVTASAAGGCTLRDSLNVYLSGAAPQVGITPSNNGVCPGDTITLVGQALAQNLVACGLTDSCATNNTLVSIPVPFGPSDTANSTGTGTGGYTDVYCSPFMGSLSSYKIQYLFRASELNAAGLSSGTITDISFFVKTVQSTIPYDTFAISIGCTNLDSLSDFVNGLTTVYGPAEGSVAPLVYQGWNPFPFYDPVTFNPTYYNWDGVSNLVIQVCYTINPNATSNDDFVAYTTTPYNGSSIYTGDYGFDDPPNGCTYNYAGSFYAYGINNTRATIKFGMCVPNVVTYQWSPAGSVTCPTCLTTQAVIDSTTCFTLSANDNGCSNDSTICIYTNPYIPVRITPSDTTICHIGDIVQLIASPVDTAPAGCVLGYTVDSIAYSAIAGTFTSIGPTAFKDEYGNTRATSAGAAGPYSIGFNFPFYCQTYDSFYVDADGFITFEYPYNYGMAAWEYTAETLPPSSFPPLKSIALLMGHYYLADGLGIGLGNAKYELTGTAPNRLLVVKYTNAEDYNIGTSRTNGEIVLHETTGIIDILITSTTYSGDPHTTGVIDSTGYGTAAPGMNNQYYTVPAGSPVAWRFTPQYGQSVVQTGLLWQNGQGISPVNDTMKNVSVAPDSSHMYYVQASYIINQFTNPEGCVVHDSSKIIIAPLIDAIQAVPPVICPGNTAQLSLTTTTGITSYKWNHGTDLSDSTISNPIATISDSTLFIVSLVNSMGCTAKDSLTLNTFPNQYPVIGPSTTICYSDSVELSLYGSYSNFQWYYIDTASGIHTLVSSGPSDSTYYAHPPGYYDLVVTANPSGCDYTTNAVFVDTFAREAIAVDTSGPTSFCAGGFVTLSVTPGLNNIMWTPDSFGSQMFIPVSSSGTFSYTARDAHNCLLFSNTVTVTVDPRPLVSIAFSKNPVCTGETAQIIATTTPPGVPVVWQLAGTQVATGDTFSGAAPGSYEVIAAPACPDTVPAVLNSAVSPTVTLGPNIDSCTCSPNIVIDPVVNPSSAQDSFSWSTGTSGSTYAVTTSGSGTYTVTVFDANNCSATASIAVNVICVPTTAFASPDTTFPGGTFMLSDSPSVSGFSYLWTTADSSTIANATQVQTNATAGNMQAGIDTFHLHVTDPSSACYGDTVLYVIVITKDSFVFPTAFTPNGDGKNDYFFPVFNSVSAAHISVLRIYDRWGQLVYDNPNTPGWDGNYGNKPQPIGTYIVFMTVEVPDPGDASKLIQRSVEASFELQR